MRLVGGWDQGTVERFAREPLLEEFGEVKVAGAMGLYVLD